jgi:AcrR family transcriptional regulator
LTQKYDVNNMMDIMLKTPTRKEASHERIVAVASRAIRRAGTRGVGVADIMKEAGLTHGGFYAHFESRDALVVEAMQRAWQDSSALLTQAIDRGVAHGESRFTALVRVYLHEKHLERVEDGCIVAALASEMPRLGDAVREETQRRVAALVDLVRSTLPPSDHSAQAEGIAATLVGALQLARVLGGTPGRELLARTREHLLTTVDLTEAR